MPDPIIPNIPGSLPSDQTAFFMSIKRSVEYLMGHTRNTDLARAVRVHEISDLVRIVTEADAAADVSRSTEIPDPPTDLVVDPSTPFVHRLTWINPEDPIVSHIEVWASVNTTSRDSATLIGIYTVTETARGEGGLFLHSGIIVTSDYTYWIRSVSFGGIYSVWAPPDVLGGYIVEGVASVQETIDEILAVLHGEITENELYLALNERLDSHDGLIPRVNAVEGRYTVKIDSDGYVSGFGFAVNENDGVPESEFIFLTDKFKIVTPGDTPKIPFAVGEVGGVSTVGIQGSLVIDGTILGSAIQAGSVTADRMDMANAFVGMTIQSTNFDTGVSGWRITADGGAEFNSGFFSVAYGDISGPRPPVDADRTAANVAADTALVSGVTAAIVKNNAALGSTFTSSDAGALAYLADLDGQDISNAIAYGQTLIAGGYVNTALIIVDTAQITDAAITTAKIKDLNVDTLQVADNAISTMTSAAAAGSIVGIDITVKTVNGASTTAELLVIGSITVGVSSTITMKHGTTIMQQATPVGGTLATMVRKLTVNSGTHNFSMGGPYPNTFQASIAVFVTYK